MQRECERQVQSPVTRTSCLAHFLLHLRQCTAPWLPLNQITIAHNAHTQNTRSPVQCTAHPRTTRALKCKTKLHIMSCHIDMHDATGLQHGGSGGCSQAAGIQNKRSAAAAPRAAQALAETRLTPLLVRNGRPLMGTTSGPTCAYSRQPVSTCRHK